MEVSVKALNPELVHEANYNSFGGKRGDISAASYNEYIQRVLSWPISDEKKQKITDQVYSKYSEILRHEARHVSVIVAGPAKYNAKRLDHSDAILRLSSEFSTWFSGIEKQVKAGEKESDKDEVEHLVKRIRFADSRPELDPSTMLAELATKDNAKFIELFEELYPKYKWRKNSNMYKLYVYSREGKIKEVHPETFFEDANFTAYMKGDRAFIRFVMKPKRQLIVALKSRGWWWNSGESAWSTYPDRVDKEWVAGISTQYAKYV